MVDESHRSEFWDELERRVNRSLLFDLAHDGILFNEERARAGPCECFVLPSGKRFCWDKGIIGALSQDQIREYCPPERSLERPPGQIPGRITQFIEASEKCEKGKVFEGKTITSLQERLACMSVEASRRGLKI